MSIPAWYHDALAAERERLAEQEALAEDRADSLREARGIINALILSAPIWLGVIAWVVWHCMRGR